jgi:hypothetical protein
MLKTSGITIPLILKLHIIRGTMRQARLGKKRCSIPFVVTWFPIHSTVEVISPIGDHTPPALAAIITIPVKTNRCFGLLISFRRSKTIKSMVALQKKVNPDLFTATMFRQWKNNNYWRVS